MEELADELYKAKLDLDVAENELKGLKNMKIGVVTYFFIFISMQSAKILKYFK